MGDARATNPLVEQFRRGGIARDLRLMGAQGLLPLDPTDLSELWCFLIKDPDSAVVDAATESLGQLPAEEFLPIAKDKDTPEAVLAWLVTQRPDRELREAAIQNPSTEDAPILEVASRLPLDLVELVVINQVRLLRNTPLLVAVESNPNQ